MVVIIYLQIRGSPRGQTRAGEPPVADTRRLVNGASARRLAFALALLALMVDKLVTACTDSSRLRAACVLAPTVVGLGGARHCRATLLGG